MATNNTEQEQKLENPATGTPSTAQNAAAKRVQETSQSGNEPPTAGTEPKLPENKKHTGLIVTIIAIAVIVIGGGIGYYFWDASRAADKERTAYELLENNYDIQDYEDFLTTYPESAYVPEVEERLQKLRNMLSSWNNISQSGRQSDFVSFKERFQDPRFDKLCDEKIDSLDWIDAQRLNTEDAYRLYLATHPNGRYAAEASVAQSTSAEFSVDETERFQVERVLEGFFNAFSQNDAAAICSYIPPRMEQFLSQKQATKAEVVRNISNMFADDIISCTFTTNNDFVITKVPNETGGTDYKVNFSVDQHISRNDEGKTFGSYTATACLNEQFQIKLLTMDEVSRQTNSEEN